MLLNFMQIHKWKEWIFIEEGTIPLKSLIIKENNRYANVSNIWSI